MRRRFRRVSPAFVPLALLALAGCGTEESIRTYDLPKAEKYTAHETPPGEYRLLGAMFPADEPEWFFKFAGKAEQVAKYEAEFDKLLTTVRMVPPKKKDPHAEPDVPEFETPAGWIRTGPRVVSREGMPIRIQETLRFGSAEEPMEVTITYSRGSVLDNVGRWATQVGHPYPRSEELPRISRRVEAVGVRGLRVDLDGPKNPAAAGRPKMMGR
jgi:hypothetical protein